MCWKPSKRDKKAFKLSASDEWTENDEIHSKNKNTSIQPRPFVFFFRGAIQKKSPKKLNGNNTQAQKKTRTSRRKGTAWVGRRAKHNTRTRRVWKSELIFLWWFFSIEHEIINVERIVWWVICGNFRNKIGRKLISGVKWFEQIEFWGVEKFR